ncbi:mitochondrial mRNA pseudouridine synthase RPUSD3-like [Lycorma delicatula]|uniref:mitochondrial mRNA pseudouridine synthase RPUSD3-like n=1 Tax=Lycorma delicatula TaxID=130591 RepID=UPI003F516BFD
MSGMKSVIFAVHKPKIKFLCRCFCSNLNKHPYDEIVPFHTNRQLAKYVCENILYNKNGIIVCNKPYGISFSRTESQWKKGLSSIKSSVITHKVFEEIQDHTISNAEDKINLFDALPYIKSNLSCESLCVIKCPEKYTTGVAILGQSENVRSKVQICWERSRGQKIPLESYLAICTGKPLEDHVDNLRIGITLDVSENGKMKKAYLTKKYSHASVLKSRVKVASVESHLLSTNENQSAALLNLVTNQKKWHFVRLFLATYLLSPAIGDHIFASRVKKIMGMAVPVDHWNPSTLQPQKLDKNLLKSLELLPGSEKFIPTMIHLSEVKLIGFPKRSQDLVLSAPPPQYFTWTLNRLGLHLQENLPSLLESKPLIKQISASNQCK